MNISLRDWATPMVAGAFLLSAVTGILIFFHLDSGLNKTAHEWLGWALVIGALSHLASNFTAFKKRIQQPLTKIIIGLFATLLLVSFIPVGDNEGEGKAVMRTGIDRLSSSPLSVVAQVAQKDADTLIQELKAADINVTSPDQSIKDISEGDRETEIRALKITFENKK